jgi:predicted HAD superfamily Cof-like phosphohydrolase
MSLNIVKEFAQANMKLPDKPVVMGKTDVMFLVKMVISELKELMLTVIDKSELNTLLDQAVKLADMPTSEIHTMGNKQIVDQIDALVDAVYYIAHSAAKFGFDLDKYFYLVHDANMRKRVDGKFILRPSDGKIMKPDDWKPADLYAEFEQANISTTIKLGSLELSLEMSDELSVKLKWLMAGLISDFRYYNMRITRINDQVVIKLAGVVSTSVTMNFDEFYNNEIE